MGDSIFITEVVIGLIVLWLMPPANGWSMKTSTWPFSYTFCGVLNINDNMASKQKKAGKIYRKNQKKITEQKSRNWTDLETEEFCRVLADPDSDFCLTLEKKALKKTANKDSNKEVFEAIQAELNTHTHTHIHTKTHTHTHTHTHKRACRQRQTSHPPLSSY